MTVRRRLPADDDAIRRLNDGAFGGPAESKLVSDLRAADLAVIELVALLDGDIAGHILFSALSVRSDGRPVAALALAPMAVWPDHQRSGIGTALVRAGLEAAHGGKWHAVIVLGHPTYYPRFAFSAERARHLKAPFRGDAFMALELEAGALDGAEVSVVYPPAFGVTPPPAPSPAG
jgi:putative acetyltransferase